MAINDPPKVPDGFKVDNPGAFTSTVLHLGKTIGNDRVNELVANPALPCPKEFVGKYEERMLSDLRASLKPRPPLPNPSDPRFDTSPPTPLQPPPVPASEAEAYQVSFKDVVTKGPGYAEAFQKAYPKAFAWIREQHRDRIQPGRLRRPPPGLPVNPGLPKNAA